jgi:DnaK suppressor protein
MAKKPAKKKASKKKRAKAAPRKKAGKASKKRTAKASKKKAARAPKKKAKTGGAKAAVKKKKKTASKSKPRAAPRTKAAAEKNTKKTKAAVPKSSVSGGKLKSAPRSVKPKPAPRRPPLNLARFRSRLRARQAELLQAYISTKVDSRSREVDGTEDYIDYAVSSYDREFLLSLTEMEQNQLTLVEDALKRLDARRFGLCTQCERPIPTKRLEVQPWARYCLRCQEIADQGLSGDDGFPSDDDERPDRPAAGAGVEFEDEESGEDDRLVEGG